MFVGHYAPALALKRMAPAVPLAALCVATQLPDIIWSVLVLAHVEHATVIQDVYLTPLRFDQLPFSHSLLTVALWALAAGGLAALVWRKAGAQLAFTVVALTVLSHWVLDWIMQRGDLPLWPGGPKTGLSLLDVPVVAIPLELGVMIGGVILYARATRANGPFGEVAPFLTAVLLAFAYAAHTISPPPDNDVHLAWMALVTFAVFTLGAACLDYTRTPRAPNDGTPAPVMGERA